MLSSLASFQKNIFQHLHQQWVKLTSEVYESKYVIWTEKVNQNLKTEKRITRTGEFIFDDGRHNQNLIGN